MFGCKSFILFGYEQKCSDSSAYISCALESVGSIIPLGLEDLAIPTRGQEGFVALVKVETSGHDDYIHLIFILIDGFEAQWGQFVNLVRHQLHVGLVEGLQRAS